MSQIRRQSILSTMLVYVGFAIGFINTYYFTRQGYFTESQYGLTALFINIGNLMFAFANFGMLATVYKFYPYYKDNLAKKENDLFTWALLISIFGFLLVTITGIFMKDLVVRKFGRSPELIQYYFWIFPFGFSLLLFSVLEVFAWNIRKSIFTTFLREVLFKGLTTLLIFLFVIKTIKDFDHFIKLYAFTYGIVAATLLVYLTLKKEFYLTLTISRVTRKFYKKMLSMISLVYFGGIVLMIAQVIELLVIASLVGSSAAGIYALGNVVAGLVQAPQRGAVAASIPVLSKAWKDKDMDKIATIYQRSGINLLIASLGIFLIVWLNYSDAVHVFHLKEGYLASEWIFFFLGLAKVVDLGTGVNSTIIGTSIHWRFELISGMVLVALIIPLNYLLVKKYGIIGAGYSNLISFTIYNTIRIIFLRKKFNMHPFSLKTIYAILCASVCYLICFFLFQSFHGFLFLALKSIFFIGIYLFSILYFKLSPDFIPVWITIKKRLRLN